MISLSIKKLPERCLWCALLLCTVYDSYRYPLQLSDSGTSPTYANTPLIIQLPKFIIVLALCLIVFPYIFEKLLPFRKWVLAVLMTCMCAYAILKAVVAESGDRSAYLIAAFWPLAALALALAVSEVTTDALHRYFRFVLIYGLASTVLQVVLFIAIGRLPALAYRNSFSVRFGGFLDDPNAFAALLYMLIGWVYYTFSGFKRFSLITLLLLCVVITQSLTALGFLVLLTLLFIVIHFIVRPRPLLAIGVCTVIGTILALVWTPLVDLITNVLETKSGSVDTHLEQVSGSQQTTMELGWLFGRSSFKQYESWWTGSLVNFGIVWYMLTLVVVITLAVSVFLAFRRARHRQDKAVLFGILMLSCYFIFGNINLPFFVIFPDGFLFFLFTCLVFFGKIKIAGSLVEEPLPPRRPPLTAVFDPGVKAPTRQPASN